MSNSHEIFNTIPRTRWSTERDLEVWLLNFKKAFPRHAQRAERLAALLADYPSYEDLKVLLPLVAKRSPVQAGDIFYSSASLYKFYEDRTTLVNECSMTYSAAHQFLSLFPVGSSADGISAYAHKLLLSYPFDESLTYTVDSSSPPSPQAIQAVLDDQYEAARLKTPTEGSKDGSIANKAIINCLLNHYGFTLEQRALGAAPAESDTEACLRAGVMNLYAGSITTRNNLEVNFFAAPHQFDFAYCRDTLFHLLCYSAFTWLEKSDSYTVIWNERPTQLLRGDKFYTSVGWLLTTNQPVPLFLHDGPNADFESMLMQSMIDADKPTAQSEDERSQLLRLWLSAYKHVTGQNLNLDLEIGANGWASWATWMHPTD